MFVVLRLRSGPEWDPSLPLEEQSGWDEHAAFMDELTEDGVVVLGGPVGEGDGEDALLVVDLESEAAIRACLADDPWGDDMLTIRSVEHWSVWLGAPP